MRKKFSITTACFLLTLSLCAQHFNFQNRSFINSFKNQTFHLSELQPASGKYWQLIAGQCTDEQTYDKDTVFKKIIDSVKCRFIHENISRLYTDSIKILRQQIAYYECLKKQVFCKDKNNPCDSLKLAIQNSGYVGAVGLAEYFDAKVKNERLDYFYKIDYLFASSSKFSKPSSLFNYCITKGWATWCPPRYCDWFIVSYKNSIPTVVNNRVLLLKFLGKIDNVQKAYLLVMGMRFGESLSYPQDGIKFSYTQVGSTFYIMQNLRLSDCPIRNYSCLISITSKGEVKIIDKKQIGEDGECI